MSPLIYGNPACLGGSRDTCQSIVIQSPFVYKSPERKESFEKIFRSILKNRFHVSFQFYLI